MMVIDVDQFKPHIANSVISLSGLTAIHTQMGYDDVGSDKCIAPVKDKAIIREILIELIQYKNPGRLAVMNP